MKNFVSIFILTLTSYCVYGQTFNPTPSINATGAANTFVGGYTFAYATSGSPWNGAFMSFGGLTNRYDCQFSTDYLVGNHISFRTHNGDAPNVWNPWYELYHSGNLNNSSTDFTARNITTSGLHAVSGTYSAAQGSYLGWNMSHSTGEVNFVNNIGGGTGGFYFDDTSDGTTFTRLMTIQGNGNVSIGTTDSKGYKFAVNGSVIATSITVKLYANWADYVFKKDYQLRPLTEVKTYIDQNHHLPEMPSEAEVVKDGINLGEMNKLLTKKVEELTLYLIDQQKIQKQQQDKIEAQDDRIKKLEADMKQLLKQQ